MESVKESATVKPTKSTALMNNLYFAD